MRSKKFSFGLPAQKAAVTLLSLRALTS